MMYDNNSAGAGLRIVFYSIILSIAGIIFSIVPLFGILGMIAALAATPVAAYGYSIAAKGHPDYIMAMYLTIGNIVIGVADMVLGGVALLGTLIDIAGMACTALIVYVVCTTTYKLVTQPDGTLVWQLFAGCSLLSVVLTLLSKIPLIGWLAVILNIPVAIALLVANILFMVFLWKAQAALL